jgi:hypothetical protein
MADRTLNSRQLLDALTYQLTELGKADPDQLRTVHAALAEAERIIGAAAERVEQLAPTQRSSRPSRVKDVDRAPMTVFSSPTRA